MIANINTNVFKVFQIGRSGPSFVDMSQEFDDLSSVLRQVLSKWNEVQERNNALLSSTPESAERLKAMAETLMLCAEKGKENHP